MVVVSVQMAFKLVSVLIGNLSQSVFETGQVDLVYDAGMASSQTFAAQFGFEATAQHLFPAFDTTAFALSIDHNFAGSNAATGIKTAAEISFNNLYDPAETVRLEYAAASMAGTPEAMELFNLRHPDYSLPVICGFGPTDAAQAYPEIPDYALVTCFEPTDPARAYPEIPEFALAVCIEPTEVAPNSPEIPEYSLVFCIEPIDETLPFNEGNDQTLVLADQKVVLDRVICDWPLVM